MSEDEKLQYIYKLKRDSELITHHVDKKLHKYKNLGEEIK